MTRTTFPGEDFLDFSFNGRCASEFGLIRVINGKRQDDIVLPTSKDTTIDIPGSDGAYYLNSKYQQREFTINFAYDGIGDEDIRAIREWLSPKKECKLIFAEHPYKYYMAKVKGTPKLSYIAFDDPSDQTVRIYKGEGSVQFICYYPWARSVSTKAADIDPNYAHSQWFASSGLLGEEETHGYLYNGGQRPAPFKLFFSIGPSGSTIPYASIGLQKNGRNIPGATLYLDLKHLSIPSGTHTYMYDSEARIISCVENIEYVDGNLTYDIEMDSQGRAIIINGAIMAGDFFDIPVASLTDKITCSLSGVDLMVYGGKIAFYDFLYY